jgi:hypothetical protein
MTWNIWVIKKMDLEFSGKSALRRVEVRQGMSGLMGSWMGGLVTLETSSKKTENEQTESYLLAANAYQGYICSIFHCPLFSCIIYSLHA